MSARTPPAAVNRPPSLRYRLHWRQRSVKTGYFLTALIVALVLGLPLLYMFATSFKPSPEVFRTPPAFFPQKWTLEGYRELINLSNVPIGFRNSTIVSTLSSTLGVLLSIGLCYVLTRFRLPGMGFFSFMTLFVYILPSILLAIPLFQLWARLGLAGGLLPLTLTYVSITLPFAIWMMRSYFAGIPLELEEAALVDGATRSQAFLKIVLPWPGRGSSLPSSSRSSYRGTRCSTRRSSLRPWRTKSCRPPSPRCCRRAVVGCRGAW
jgi:ABC-type glycerol-3-phosphate transport system permease component